MPYVHDQGIERVSAAVCLLVTIALICWAVATRPSGAQCPPRWYVDGVRPDGSYQCRPVPLHPETDATWQHPDITPFDDRVIGGQIYCGAGTVPLVIDERTVACRAVRR